MDKPVETTPDATVSFEDAFAAAISEHSAPPAEPAQKDAAETNDVPVETDDTQTGGDADAGEKSEEAQDSSEEEGADNEPLLSEEDTTRLESDPKAQELYRRLNQSYTQKTQALAAERKRLQQLAQYETLIRSYEKDPEGTVKQLAAAHKIFQIDQPAPAQTEPTLQEKIVARFKERLKVDDLEEAQYITAKDIVDSLGAIMAEFIPVAAASAPDVQEIKQKVTQFESGAVRDQVRSDIDALTKRHPDWRKYDQAMAGLMKKIGPQGDITAAEYLDSIYTLASGGAKKASQTRDVVQKINRAAKVSQKPGAQGVDPTLVRPTSDKPIDIEEAYAMALRNETVAD